MLLLVEGGEEMGIQGGEKTVLLAIEGMSLVVKMKAHNAKEQCQLQCTLGIP